MVEVLEFDVPAAVIGDIHGERELLDKLLRLIGSRPVVCCGDLVDRGPDSKGVIEMLIGRGARSVRGNHEEWLIALCGGQFDSFALHPVMGGRATLRSYGIEGSAPGELESQAWKIPAAHRAFVCGLPVAIDLRVMEQRFWITHAGVPTLHTPCTKAADIVPYIAKNKPSLFLWTQTPPEDTLPVDRPVIMGHMPQRAPIDLGHVIAIDTGAGTCEPRALSALLLPERKFITVT